MRLGAVVGSLACLILQHVPAVSAATPERPNIVVLMGDDIGYWNVSAYSRGMMVPTPHIDRIADEGLLFTDHYAEPSCTAGRAAFLTGQYPIRTGLTTVGLPGSPLGHDRRDPSIAEVLKTQGYATGYFGKSHLGDRDQHLPTAHGLDEFFGDLYHLNSEVTFSARRISSTTPSPPACCSICAWIRSSSMTGSPTRSWR